MHDTSKKTIKEIWKPVDDSGLPYYNRIHYFAFIISYGQWRLR